MLLVSLTPGGPNGGSATQYFIGDFDGHHFTPEDSRTRWLDFGPDNYAGVTWAGVDDRALFIGWMSNWQYAASLPTAPWRSAMTMPRELALRQVGADSFLASQPARELQGLRQAATLALRQLVLTEQARDLSAALRGTQGRFVLSLSTAALRGFTLTLSNADGDRLDIGYDPHTRHWWIDRRGSGAVDFHPAFAGRHSAPRIAQPAATALQLWFDATSVELFADDGLTTLTSLHFPRRAWSRMALLSADGMVLDALGVNPLRDRR